MTMFINEKLIRSTYKEWEEHLKKTVAERSAVNYKAEHLRKEIQKAQYVLAALNQVDQDIQDNR